MYGTCPLLIVGVLVGLMWSPLWPQGVSSAVESLVRCWVAWNWREAGKRGESPQIAHCGTTGDSVAATCPCSQQLLIREKKGT